MLKSRDPKALAAHIIKATQQYKEKLGFHKCEYSTKPCAFEAKDDGNFCELHSCTYEGCRGMKSR